MKNLFIITLLLISTAMAATENISEIRDILKEVETNHNPEKVGDFVNGIPTSYGILQIQKGAIDDVNEKFGTSYTHQDAFDITCAEEIFELYIKRWTTHLKKKEGREATAEDIVRIWNGGPRGYLRESTKSYLAKYKKYRYLCELKKREKLLKDDA
jgi:hypothetical protein